MWVFGDGVSRGGSDGDAGVGDFFYGDVDDWAAVAVDAADESDVDGDQYQFAGWFCDGWDGDRWVGGGIARCVSIVVGGDCEDAVVIFDF